MKIYIDSELRHEIKDDTFDLGIVPAGEVKKFTFYVVNEKSNHVLEKLKFTVKHNEVEVIEAPEKMNPNSSHVLVLQWSPSVTLEEGLKVSLAITGIKLCLPMDA